MFFYFMFYIVLLLFSFISFIISCHCYSFHYEFISDFKKENFLGYITDSLVGGTVRPYVYVTYNTSTHDKRQCLHVLYCICA